MCLSISSTNTEKLLFAGFLCLARVEGTDTDTGRKDIFRDATPGQQVTGEAMADRSGKFAREKFSNDNRSVCNVLHYYQFKISLDLLFNVYNTSSS